jgi:cysteine desulfurase
MAGVPGAPDRLTYLDHAATTPLRPEARAAMLPWLGESFGNPSGAHAVARAARQAVDEARDAVAELLGCAPNELVFTGGGTEADNLAIRGTVEARPGAVLCSAVEHHAVHDPVERVGGKVVPVDRRGVLDLTALDEALDAHPDTTLVSVMGANNEVGTIQPVAEVARHTKRRVPGASVHCDAVQAAAWLDTATLAADADLVSVSAHKFGGPQGVGALVVRRGTPLRAQLLGGGQEREMRSGTHNVAGIVGMAAALTAKADHRVEEAARASGLRDQLAEGLLATIPDVTETAAGSARERAHILPGTLHLTIPGVESEALLFLLDEAGICASAASACASGAQEASHVLAAMGVPPAARLGTLRLSLGWTSDQADIDHALDVVPQAVARLRSAHSGARSDAGSRGSGR